jgi:hypothetical protein
VDLSDNCLNGLAVMLIKHNILFNNRKEIFFFSMSDNCAPGNQAYKGGESVFYNEPYQGDTCVCDKDSVAAGPGKIVRGNYAGDAPFCQVDVCVPDSIAANVMRGAKMRGQQANIFKDGSCPQGFSMYQGSPAEDWTISCSNVNRGPAKC